MCAQRKQGESMRERECERECVCVRERESTRGALIAVVCAEEALRLRIVPELSEFGVGVRWHIQGGILVGGYLTQPRRACLSRGVMSPAVTRAPLESLSTWRRC